MYTRREAVLGCLSAALAVLVSAGLIVAATVLEAPPAALPFVVLVCVTGPMAASIRLPEAIAVLRRDHSALASLRAALARLPETEHPLGL